MTKTPKFFNGFINPFKSPFGKGPQRQEEEELERIAAREQKEFSLQSLVAATQNFHSKNQLGAGDFGPVFKGKLADGREIAVKRLLRSSMIGKKEFMDEARLLVRAQHKNVVNLLGFCADGAERLLVYEYAANECLDKHLFKSKEGKNGVFLEWKKRYDVIVGVGRGLLYLHEDTPSCIIHRDIRATNVLLDDKWSPKITDFGMSRLFPEDQTGVNTRVAGTNGYMAPEYVMHGHLSVKADVFSYGVLVLELISGRKNSTFNDPEAPNLLELAWKYYKKGRGLEIMDPALTSSTGFNAAEVWFCVQMGLLCAQADPKARPTMRQVMLMLSKKPAVLDEPMRPGQPGSRYRRPRKQDVTSSSVGANARPTSGVGDPGASSSSRGKQPMEIYASK